jgi:hypothetical protein
MATAIPIVGAAAGVGKLAGKASKVLRGGDTTTLYRAVTEAELKSIKSTKSFTNPKGIENKYFSTTAEGASSYGKQASKAFGDGPHTIIKTEIPTSSITPNMRVPNGVDGGIPTVVVPTNKLPGLNPQPLNYSPIP